MGHKLLFVLGIVVAHGALAAGLASEDGSPPRNPVITTCAKAPVQPFHVSPPKELLAYVNTAVEFEGRVMRQ